MAVAAVGAFLSWLLATLLVIIGIRPLGLVLIGAAAVTLTVLTLYARATALRPLEVFGFSLACILLQWPFLGFATLFMLSWTGVAKWE